MVKKIAKSMVQDFDVFLTKVQAICKKSPLTVRYVTKVRGSNDEVVIKINDDVEVSTSNKQLNYFIISAISQSNMPESSQTKIESNQIKNTSI